MSASSAHGPRSRSKEPRVLRGRHRREADPPGGGLGAQGGHLVACAVQVTVARGQPARDVAPGGGKLDSSLRFSAGRSRCPLSASSFAPAGRWAGISSTRLVCARTARFCAQGALWDPRLAARLGSQGSLETSLDCEGDQVCLRSVLHG